MYGRACDGGGGLEDPWVGPVCLEFKIERKEERLCTLRNEDFCLGLEWSRIYSVKVSC